jgi:hypothetical protein
MNYNKSKKAYNDLKRRNRNKINGWCIQCGKNKKAEIHQHCINCWFKTIALARTGSRKNWIIIKRILKKQKYKCIYTGIKLLPGINASLDHKIPTSKGGTNDSSNLQWVDLKINRMKNNCSHKEFIQIIYDILVHMKKINS